MNGIFYGPALVYKINNKSMNKCKTIKRSIISKTQQSWHVKTGFQRTLPTWNPNLVLANSILPLRHTNFLKSKVYFKNVLSKSRKVLVTTLKVTKTILSMSWRKIIFGSSNLHRVLKEEVSILSMTWVNLLLHQVRRPLFVNMFLIRYWSMGINLI